MSLQTPAGLSALPNGHERRNARHKRTAASSRDHAEARSSLLAGAGRDSRMEGIESTRRSSKTTHRTLLSPETLASEKLPAEPVSAQSALPWDPQASLLSHSSAPLAGRISRPPPAVSLPTVLQPRPLQELSLRSQEEAVTEDLLHVLMGFEGQYCQYKDTYQASDEDSRLEGPQFVIAAGLDPSLESLAHQVLATASHYAAVVAFIDIHSQDVFGAVNHALCATMRKPLKDYLVLVAQLENQMLINTDFTLHVMCLHLRPMAHTMLQIFNLTREIINESKSLNSTGDVDSDDEHNYEAVLASLRDGPTLGPANKTCKGGAVLRLIDKRLQLMSGDPTARKLLAMLLRESSRPYLTMLNGWLHRGDVRDPHQEFMIKEQKSMRREDLGHDYIDGYWEKRFTICDEFVPPRLEAVKERVLLAGKYLSIVRECGGVDVARDMDDDDNIPHTIDEPGFLDNVSTAYAFANSSLLALLLTTHSLPDLLRSLKHYFFLDRSDFFSSFLHLADTELRKSAKQVNVHKLQSLLDIVLRQAGSVSADDPLKEDVTVVINETGLTKWLMHIVSVKGLDADGGSFMNTPVPSTSSSMKGEEKEINGFGALTLDFAVPFPLSLVVSRVTITRYQVLFRYLLSLRHLETSLTSTWKTQQKDRIWLRRSSDKRLESWKRRAWCLRSRMLCFVQQLLYFCTSEVIEPNWTAFMARLEAAERAQSSGTGKTAWTVDELMQDHVGFLASCLKECMLTNSTLLHCNPKVIQTCTMFADWTNHFTRYLEAAESSTSSLGEADAASASKGPSQAFDKMHDSLKRFEDHFSKGLKTLLDVLNHNAATECPVFLNLCARLSMASENASGLA